jgi:ATP-binding cassette subfamily B protein
MREALRLVWNAGPVLLTAVLTLAVMSALLVLLQLLLIREVLAQLLTTVGANISRGLLVSLLLLVAVGAVAQLATLISQLLQRLLGQRVLRSATRQLLEVTSEVDAEAFESETFFQHLKRVEQNGLLKPMQVVQALSQLIAGAVNSLVVVVFLATLDPLLVLMLVVAAVPGYVMSRKGGNLEFGFALHNVSLVRERQYVGHLLRDRESAKELRSFESVDFFRERWEALWDRYLHGFQAMTARRATMALAGSCLSATLVLLVAIYLVWRVQTGAIVVASAGAAFVAMRFLAQRVQEAGQGLASLLESRLYLQDLHDFVETYRPRTRPARELPTPAAISLRGVSYRYPGGERFAVHDVDLDVSAGQLVALVGPNGSGKTTLSLILSGLVSPTTGAVLWDGKCLDEGDLAAVREHVCVVFQDFVRYELSVRENVVVGRASGEDHIREALRRSGADFVDVLPAGVETLLGKEHVGGHDLSVGQWQRIAIARAFYRNSPIVILDEPTSALDARAEHALFENLRELWRDRTVFVVSHRLANVRAADLIVVLDQGRAVERGSHDGLMAIGGLYAEMYELQSRDYRDGGSTEALGSVGSRGSLE